MRKTRRILTAALIVGCISGFNCSAQGYNIKVIRGEGESSSVIYTGPPEGYPDGSLAFLDFDDRDFYVVLDWSTDEVLYIYPISSEQPGFQNGVIDSITQTDHVENVNINGVNSIGNNEVSVTIDENLNEQDIAADFTIHNTGDAQMRVKLIGALYKSGGLVDAITKTVTVEGGEECEETVVLEIGANQADTAKFFAWDDTSMKPLCDSLQISRPEEDEEDEIFENESKHLTPGKSYLFRPKRNGVYSFSGAENISLYKKAFGVLSEIDTNSALFYPNHYYIETDVVSDIEIEYSDSRLDAYAFLSGEYFSDMSDSGSLYRGNTMVYSSLARWLCKGNNLFFNSDGLKMVDESTNEVISLQDGINPYFITADGDTVYFADQNNSGKICKYQDGQLSIVCNDKAAWLCVDGEYIYYKNLLDGGREYRIGKNAQNAPCGELTE